MDAADENVVSARLRAENISPDRIRKTGGGWNINIGTGVKQKDLMVFTRQLSTMIDAGLPLVQALDILANQAPNKHFAKIITSVKASVESGATFSEALGKHPRVFDPLYVNLIAAAEIGGILDTVLLRLAAYIEKSVKLKRQVKGAMVYPITIVMVALGVIVIMLTKIIPMFQQMYADMNGAKLPAPTQMVINASNSFLDHWYLYFGGMVAFIVGMILVLRNPRSRLWFDRNILRVPIFGTILRKVVVARFTQTLGTLLTAGVPILDALDVCAKAAGNTAVARGILVARARVSEGKDLATPLGQTKLFPTMVIQMVGVGEQTGALDSMLQKIADFYEEEVDVAVAALTSMLEPVMMVVLGGLIGGLIVALYLPVFNMAGNL
ncbi:MAG TPA: type II secretion system F family protein [Kofleriaceae bacterium]|nr:type II secretion system F family protein [Kofleriaceae bacterium]